MLASLKLAHAVDEPRTGNVFTIRAEQAERASENYRRAAKIALGMLDEIATLAPELRPSNS
jgi:hypothetical protein